uniref:Uncharacterized protein n=1 Tax=Anopheles maculatus TaxID=74869 RepID=A0A182SFA5_9DIPT
MFSPHSFSPLVHLAGGSIFSNETDVPCPFGTFKCPEGKCIPQTSVCNYQKDCDKGEDELNHCPPPECEPGQISCGQYVFNKTYCIPPHYKCDMTIDCVDGTDESDCTYRKCQQDDIRCGTPSLGVSLNGRVAEICVPKEKRCDGYLDCRTGKDEEGCTGTACRLDQFRCANGVRCIDTSLKCNHKNDCGDNSDEVGCSKFRPCSSCVCWRVR